MATVKKQTKVGGFLNSLFHFDEDAGFMEKFITVAVPVLAGIFFFWLIASSYGIFNNDISRAHERTTHPGQAAIIATILFAGAAVWAWFNWTDRIKWRVNDVVATVILLVLIALGVLSNTGFYTTTY